MASIPAEEEDYAIAVRKNDKELLDKINAALDKIKANGEYDKLLKKYIK
ncbi:transporter substrate-binding domain-containing protein [Klebsiella pneumoniae]